MLRRSLVLFGLMALGCDDGTPDAADANTAADAPADDVPAVGDASDAASPLDAGSDASPMDAGPGLDAPAPDTTPVDDLGLDAAPSDLGADAATTADADATADVTADAATDAPITDAAVGDAVAADVPAMVDVPVMVDVPAVVDAPAVVDVPADAGAADVPPLMLPPAPTAPPVECSVADRTGSPAVNVDSDTADSQAPSVVWTGSEFGLAWSDLRHPTPEIYFARFRDATIPRGAIDSVTRVTVEPAAGAGANEQPSIAWDGTRYWITWSRVTSAGVGSIRAASVTPAGATASTIGPTATVSTGTLGYTARPSLVAIPAGEGGGLAVAWEDDRATDNAEIYFARLDAAGARSGAEVRVTTADGLSGSPRLVHGPAGELGLGWIDERHGSPELYFARLTVAGARPAGAADVRLTTDALVTANPSLAFDGTGYGIAWESEAGVPDRPAVFFALLDARGVRRPGAPDLRLSSNLPGGAARRPSLAWSGADYLAVWQDERPTHTGGDLAMQRLSALGARVGAETFLYDDTDASQRPALVWAGTQFLVAWEDDQYSHRDIWYRRILPTECRP
ncbi:MAG: hypothetical protein Q8S73_08260 [Deltaproteobacteria bacterium]|nr:hypothetical protein [Myxococcales bacterium]MDP3214082.1 hypothetical protein [Deltaproteobacteria bacterium]